MKKIKIFLLFPIMLVALLTAFNSSANSHESKTICADSLELDSIWKEELEKRLNYTKKILNEHIVNNKKAIASGKLQDGDYIVDLRRYYTGDINPFIKDSNKESDINLTITNFEKETNKAVYVLLSPLIPEYEDPRFQSVTFKNQEKLANDKRQIQLFKEKYIKNIQTYWELVLEKNAGALLYVSSELYLDHSENIWRVRYKDQIHLPENIDGSIKEAMLSEIALQRYTSGISWSNDPSKREASLEKYVGIIIKTFKSKFFNIIENSDVAFTEEMMRKLDVGKRLEILKKIKDGIIQDKQIFGNGAGSTVAKIISTTPKEQQKDLLWGLRDNGLLYGLIPKIYDLYSGGDNYTEVIISVTSFMYQSKVGTLDKNTIIKNEKVFKWVYELNGLQKHRVEIFTDKIASNKIAITIRDSYKNGGPSWKHSDRNFEAEMFEWVGLALTDKISFIKVPSGVAVQNEIIFVPAIFLDYAAQKIFNKGIISGITFTINVAAFAVGVGELSAATSLSARLWASGDVLFSGLALISDNEDFKEFIQKKYGEAGVKVLDELNSLGTVFSLGYLTGGGLKALDDFANDQNLINNLRKLANDNDLATKFPEQDNTLKEAEEYFRENGNSLGGGSLVSGLSISLKNTYDELVKVGFKSVEDGSVIRFYENGQEVANISNSKFNPIKWVAIEDGDVLTNLDYGYRLVKGTDKVGFDLGFEEGRLLKAEEVNEFLYKTKGLNKTGLPYSVNTIVSDQILKKGDLIYIVEYITQVNPGGWASKDKIATLEELRRKLAVLIDWKDNTKRTIVVREYEIISDVRVRSGDIGSQLELADPSFNTVYVGGGHQYELCEGKFNNVNKYTKFMRRTNNDIELN